MGNPNNPHPGVESQVNSFSHFVQTHEDGSLNHDLTKALDDLIAELHNVAQEEGGEPSGEITLKLKFTLAAGMINVLAKNDTKMPKASRLAANYFCTANNRLTTQNPKQYGMQFRDVTAPQKTYEAEGK